MRRWRLGLAAVAATMGLLSMGVMTAYLTAYVILNNQVAAASKQEARIGQSPRTPELLSSHLYNISLCQLLFNNSVVAAQPKVAVINIGNHPAEVDSIVVNVGPEIRYMNRDKHLLMPGQVFTDPLPNILDIDLGRALVQVHTSDGGFYVGGYGIPWPEAIVSVDEDGRCAEP